MNPSKTKWLIGSTEDSRGNPLLTFYQAGNEIHWLGIQIGIAQGASGASYSSLIEWAGRKESILNHLNTTECEWFIPYFEKGIKDEAFSEADVLREFTRKNGFEPIDCLVDSTPHQTFNQQRANHAG
jgi:hypothetical protein